jgi:hypothetical protein
MNMIVPGSIHSWHRRLEESITGWMQEETSMKYLSEEYIQHYPETQDVKDCMELMLILAGNEHINSLKELLIYTAIAENEYSYLSLRHLY